MGCVSTEVDQNLVDLRGVSKDCVDIGRRPVANLDGRGNGRPQQFDGLPGDGADVDRSPLQFRYPTESQYLGNQILGPLTGTQHLVQVAIQHRLAVLHLGDFGVTDDAREDIIEVMGDAAGQGADGFHLLRLIQLSGKFGLFLLRRLDLHQPCLQFQGVILGLMVEKVVFQADGNLVGQRFQKRRFFLEMPFLQRGYPEHADDLTGTEERQRPKRTEAGLLALAERASRIVPDIAREDRPALTHRQTAQALTEAMRRNLFRPKAVVCRHEPLQNQLVLFYHKD